MCHLNSEEDGCAQGILRSPISVKRVGFVTQEQTSHSDAGFLMSVTCHHMGSKTQVEFPSAKLQVQCLSPHTWKDPLTPSPLKPAPFVLIQGFKNIHCALERRLNLFLRPLKNGRMKHKKCVPSDTKYPGQALVERRTAISTASS
jgi:hypothetical protein